MTVLVVGGLAAPFLGLLLLLRFWSVSVAARRQYDSSKLSRLGTRYSFSDAGIQAANADAASVMSWDSFHAAYETRDLFILPQTSAIMQILPKRLFQDDAQIAAFRELVQRHLGDKAKLRHTPTRKE